MAPYGITDAVIDFQQANPSYSVELIEGEGDTLKRMLLHEDIDLAFIRDGGAIEPEFKKIPFTTDRLVAVLPLDHPLAERDTVEIDDLIDENFLMLPQGSFVSELVLSLVAKLIWPTCYVHRQTSREHHLLVARGAGVSFLMRKPTESLASGKVALVPLEPATTSEVRLYLKRNAAHSQAVVSFIGFLPTVSSCRATVRLPSRHDRHNPRCSTTADL